jgi:uncharacterized protein YciI
MENKILNDKAMDVFVIIAETLAGWKNLISDEGKEVLKQHYNWAADLKSNDKLILAGPTDFELTSTNKINPIGHTTGLIMLKAKLREEAEERAFKDPFHINGFRKNVVHSMKITMTDNLLFEPLEQLIK